jgi:hypothetical protein
MKKKDGFDERKKYIRDGYASGHDPYSQSDLKEKRDSKKPHNGRADTHRSKMR